MNPCPKERQIGSEAKSTLACFTKRTKCMILSILETSLPRQKSHDTLAPGISVEAGVQNHSSVTVPARYINTTERFNGWFTLADTDSDTDNDSLKFYCQWVSVNVNTS